MPLEQGSTLHGRYQIADILGQGGMGSVYRAIDQNLGVEVAVKENLFTTDEYARQFRLEAVILASLRQPNLPRVTDHFVIGHEGQYLVMDYIEGEDLRQRMERMGTIPEEEAILIGAAICDALSYLHTRKPPVLHRDIKPGNVKITPEGHVYLVDFGLAKVVHASSQQTTTGARAMTPGYSPPEQYGTARTDPRSDIYSLGATPYAALTGIIPEDGLARMMDNTELTPLRKRNPRISRKLAAAIEKAMEPYPDDRFQSAEEFKQALLSSSTKTQKLTANVGVTPAPAGADRPPSKPLEAIAQGMAENPASAAPKSRPKRKRANRSLGWVAFLLLLTLIGIIAAGFALQNPQSIPASIASLLPPGILPAQQATATREVTPEPILPTEPVVPIENTALPTEQMVAVEPVLPSPTPSPTITPTPTITLTPIGGGLGQIAFASTRTGGKPQIYLMKSDGSNQRALTTDFTEPDGACQPDWSPDGTHIVYVSPCAEKAADYIGSSLYIVKADGTERVALPLVEDGAYDPAWSPDGTRIAFTVAVRINSQEFYTQIYVIDLSNNITTLLAGTRNEQARQPSWSPDSAQIVYTVKRVGVLQIWTMTSTGKAQEQLLRSGSAFSDYMPAWSPDGKIIMFSQNNSLPPLAPAWLMSLRYEDRNLNNAIKINAEAPVVDVRFAPDGYWLAFESVSADPKGPNQDIYIMNALGGDRRRLTTDPATDFDPAWQPAIPPNNP